MEIPIYSCLLFHCTVNCHLIFVFYDARWSLVQFTGPRPQYFNKYNRTSRKFKNKHRIAAVTRPINTDTHAYIDKTHNINDKNNKVAIPTKRNSRGRSVVRASVSLSHWLLPRMFISQRRNTRCQTGPVSARVLFRTACYVTLPLPPNATAAASGGGGANAAAERVRRVVVGEGCNAPRPLLFSGRWRRFINN